MIFVDRDAGEIDTIERGAFVAGSASNEAKTLVDQRRLIKDDEVEVFSNEGVEVNASEGFVF